MNNYSQKGVNMNNPKVALIYDFDKTLSPKDMQDYGYMEMVGINAEDFWLMCNDFCAKHKSDRILGYMCMMLKAFNEKGLNLSKEFLVSCGKNIEFYKGVETWFNRINKFGAKVGVDVEHYVVSSGLKEMIEGTPIAKYFKEIYAGYFMYDKNGNAFWPAVAINYTNKTQCIYRINKGILNIIDDSINDSMPHNERPVPFTNMIYIGDSTTDIPCMRLIMKSGGYSIGVFQQDYKNKDYLNKLITQNRINFIVEANYDKDSQIEKIVKEIIQTVKHKENLKMLTEQQKNNN